MVSFLRSFGFCVAAVGFATLGLSGLGCGNKASQGTFADAGPFAAESLTPEQAQKVLAKVGDHAITLGDYVAALEHMGQFDRLRYQSPEKRKELLNEMITVELLAQEAIAKGYDKDPRTEQEIRAVLRDLMLAEARKGSPTPGDIADSEVHAFFEAHKADYRDPERRRVSVVVLKDEASAKEALSLAKKAASATEWGEIVRSKSIDAQAKANVPVDLVGDLGIVSPPGDPRGENTRVPEQVRAAAFQIDKAGKVGEAPVSANGKFYVVRLTQILAPHDRAFVEAERAIRVKLAQDKARAKEEAFLTELRAQYPVQMNEAALAQVRVDLGDGGAAPRDGGKAP